MFVKLDEAFDGITGVTLLRELLDEEVHFKHFFDFISNYKFLQYNTRYNKIK